MNRLIIVGSPRTDGRCAHLADALFEACIEDHPEDEVALAPVSTLDVAPCTGCDGCRPEGWERGGAVPEADGAPRCVVADDMQEIYELIDAADELAVVAPVYFAGPSSQLKALLDRLEPYFYTDGRHRRPLRPATLHVVGEGGDPYGYEPLVGIVRSALSVAGFRVETVLDWVGRIDASGEITDEAVEYEVDASGAQPRPKLDLGGARESRPAKADGRAARSQASARSHSGPKPAKGSSYGGRGARGGGKGRRRG